MLNIPIPPWQLDDYLKIPRPTHDSFYCHPGEAPGPASQNGPNNQYGYPRPGPQSPTAAQATAAHYFVEDPTWANILDHGQFQDIVVGSGLCALAYVDEALTKDPNRKILILERGGFWLPEHFQNMPLPFKLVLGGPSETYPWQLTTKTAESTAKFMHGSCPFFGGRSTFWSAWSPRPVHKDKGIDLLRDFPQSMKDTVNAPGFWKRCEDLLHVESANRINDPCFGQALQREIQSRLDDGLSDIPTATMTEHARLAVGRKRAIANSITFDKFSTPGPLLAIYERQRKLAEEGKGSPLMIATDVVVERFELDGERPIVLHTSRGPLYFPKRDTNIILAAGAFPNTTILMNSVSDLKDCAGSRVSGHYISHITARFPLKLLGNIDHLEHLEIAAHYLAGEDPDTGLQYHVQITAIHSPFPDGRDAEDAARLCPDYAAAATAEQLTGSEKHIVLVCATLGELDEKNAASWMQHRPSNPDVTTNVCLQVLPNANTKSCTRVMEEATYKAIAVMAGGHEDEVEYWHDAHEVKIPIENGKYFRPSRDVAGWSKKRPPAKTVRVPGLVHETSTLYMSDNLDGDPHASVDSLYRPRGCDYVYVTGGALFPTAGSWNPTLTMCGFAQDLAVKLWERSNQMPGPFETHAKQMCADEESKVGVDL